MVKKIIGILLLFTAVVVLLHPRFQRKVDRSEPRFGGVFRIKSFADAFTPELDPASPESFIFISEQIYDGLVRLDKDFNIVPSLAEYWEISSDGLRYVFHLRKDVKFHDGRRLTAADVKFSLERLLDKKTESPYFQFFLNRVEGADVFREGELPHVSGYKTLDDHTFEIQWTRPFVSALYLLSMHFCKILPADVVQEKGRGFFQKPQGTGPFQFDYWLRGSQLEILGVRLRRNDEYFGGRPFLNAVEFCPHFTLDHFLNGEIDSIPILSERLLESHYKIYQDGSLHQIFLGMSCHLPPLDSLDVRKAVSSGLNKTRLVLAVQDARILRQVANSFIPPRLPGFFPSDDTKTFNQKRAVEMLQRAGFSDESEFPPLDLFLEEPRTSAKYRLEREIRNQLEAIGIRTRTRYYRTDDEIRQRTRPYLIIVERLMNFPDPEDIVRPLFFSKSIFNLFGYSNPVLDDLLYRAEVEKSWTGRINLFHRMEELLSTDIPALPLFSQQNNLAMQPYVMGVDWPPLGLYYLEAKKIWLDK